MGWLSKKLSPPKSVQNKLKVDPKLGKFDPFGSKAKLKNVAKKVVAGGMVAAAHQKTQKEKLADIYAKGQADSTARQGGYQKSLDAMAGQSAEQMDLAQLQASARGEGPSAAQDQLQQATDQNMRSALALGRSGRGNPALAMQSAGRQRATMSQKHAAQSGDLRAREMQTAQSNLSAAQQQNMASRNVFNQRQQQQTQYYEGLIADEDMGRYDSSLEQQNISMGADAAANAENKRRSDERRARRRAQAGAVLGAAGTVVGGIYGGPAGAAAGGKVGSSVGYAAG